MEISTDVLILVGFIALSLSLYFYLKKRNSTKSVSSTDLDKDQLEAVQTRYDVPLLVIAGPGSGKTRVIVERVKDMVIRQNVDPEKILCLTFSRAARETMQKRLSADKDLENNNIILPTKNVKTFHSICYDLQDKKNLFQAMYEDDDLNSEDEKNPTEDLKKFHEYVISNLKKFSFKRFGNGYDDIMKLIQGVSAFKRENRTSDDLDNYVEELNSINDEFHVTNQTSDNTLNSEISSDDEYKEKLTDLSVFFKEYENYLNSKRMNDFDDFLQKTNNQTNIVESLEEYQKKFEHVLIDEFQDNNYLQFEIAKKLAPTGHITVVGDLNQCIYSFQGANVETFTEFHRTYPNHKTVKLRTNYRSSPQIVNVSNVLLKNNDLTTKNPPGEKVKVLGFSNKKSELEYIKNYIFDKIGTEITERGDDKKTRLQFSDIVIIVRTNNERKEIARYLQNNMMPVLSNGKVWKNKFGIPLILEKFLHNNDLKNESTVDELIEKLSNYPDYQILLMVVREFNNAKPNSKIAEIINYYADPPESNSDKLKIAIEISTAHKTKGREFRIVIVMNSIMSHFPLNFKKRELKVPDSLRRYESKKDEETLHDEEERRLYYVAITRAKYELVITYSLQDKKENKTEMSQFLNEIIKNSNVDYQKISIDNDI